ncbi:RCC1 domain-containing protein [Pyxidicoccus sp. MSG2]|uniref:RCC1 domain-containing protein n=1 Tax=Pyxidicoccus sp. MSG2 TaxID=2996790 RepID=UPI002270333D|nr:RCC1 domain-containing protein [Pyxidicoccus sp. MSG2]MCY1019463.1 RCC1 domain-containing protein [Pyxidicoccus sp. MSG2]
MNRVLGVCLGTWLAVGCGQPRAEPHAQASHPSTLSGAPAHAHIEGGGGHSLALRPDGTAWAWGSNAYGQLGNGGPTLYTTTPTLSLLY